MDPAEAAVDAFLRECHTAAPHQLAEMIARHCATLGASDAVAYLADLQQEVLVPLLGSGRPSMGEQLTALSVDGTVAGRAYQRVEVLTQDAQGGLQVWLPLLDGGERLGVLAVTVPSAEVLEADGGLLDARLRRLASLTAELVMTKTLYGDSLVRLRRRGDMGLAAEMQWSLMPPLTFICQDVAIAGALEPAYYVAGDTVDYAVNAGRTHLAIFDGMGHGLRSAQLAGLAVAAYRNARRSDRSVTETASVIDAALLSAFSGDAFTTAVLAELDTGTGALTWVNAGHPEPLLIRDGQLVKTLQTEPALPLGLGLGPLTTTTGLPEPLLPGAFTTGTEHLQPGDQVLLYTDGVVEARSPDGVVFGIERLTDLLAQHLRGGLPPTEAMRRVVRTLLAHQQGQLTDDASLLLAEWRSGAEHTVLL